MWPLVLLWGCLVLPGYDALKGPKEISGHEGETVSVKCTYGEELRKHMKYWCRQGGILFSRCTGTIYTKGDQEVTQGRVSIRDSPQELALTVTMRHLTLQDAGKYWCGVNMLGLDETSLISLIVFPGKNDSANTTGPCCLPSPTPSFQPFTTTRSLQPKAKSWHTELPELTSSDLHTTITTAKQGKTGTKAPLSTGVAPKRPAGTSAHKGISPYTETSPHTTNSPHAGSFRPAIQLDSTITEDTSPVPSSGSSKPRVSIPLVRMLTPVLVLLSLLLATCLIALGSHMLRRKKKGEPAQLAMGTQRNEKVHLPASTLGNGCAPEDVVINLAGPAGPRECAAGPYTNIQCLNQKMKWGDGAQYTKVRHVGRETKKKEKKSPTISWLPGDNHDCRSHSATFPNFVLHKLCDVLLTE
ncbi:CMRF35-like molecule 9 isoform X3 [Castor canadensis]|uniref:CMRF35-like molecule 9 isoform X1 n=1 Tax=Castor canadensis TaxID=51338 RepID=A0A8B7VXC7_CASCN|nr:CMRF35-like molecule 9 isoform X1 [Castor canadensis]